MFGRRRRGWGGGGGNIGLFLLFFQVMNFFRSTNEFLPVTFGVLGLNVIAFLRPDINLGSNRIQWPSVTSSCISVQTVYYQQEWIRIILAPFIHMDSFHLYYNMASFMWKARTLEKHYGSGYFGYMIAVFSVLTSSLYLVINYGAADVTDTWYYVRTCAVGFSGVIFALKVVTTYLTPSGASYVMGIPVPSRLAVWAELGLISLLFPGVSFVGHLAGILVGLAFVSGPLKKIMDIPVSLTEGRMDVPNFTRRDTTYTYTAGTTGYRSGSRASTRQDTSTRTTTYRTADNYDDERLQQAIEASLREERNRRAEEDRQERPPPFNPHYPTNDGAGTSSDEEEEIVLTRQHLRSARLRRFTGQSTS